MQIGIDEISFYVPNTYLPQEDLAQARGIDPNKFLKGLGQVAMSVPTPDEDIITMAANAADQLSKESLADVSWVLFATESGTDQSKAAGLYLQSLLDLPDCVRVLELKQACYSATGGLQLAKALIAQDSSKKVLLIAADIARYGLNTTGESSQGAGAIAMIISQNPRVLSLDDASGVYTEEVMDFWRPNYRTEALVDGKFSCDVYLSCLQKSYARYVNDFKEKNNTDIKLGDFEAICFHVPVPKLAKNGLTKLLRSFSDLNTESKALLKSNLEASLHFGANTGNSYTAALYVSLLSLFCHGKKDFAGKRIGFYSYGSGSVSEFFSGVVQDGYKFAINMASIQSMLERRLALSVPQYEQYFKFKLPTDGGELKLPKLSGGRFRLASVNQHKRFYVKDPACQTHVTTQTSSTQDQHLEKHLEKA